MDQAARRRVNAVGLRIFARTAIGLLLSLVIVVRVAWAQANGTSGADAAANTSSSGAASGVEQETSGGFLDILLSGGLFGTTILLVLVVLSMLAVYLIIEQVMTLRRSEVMPSGLGEEVRQLLSQGKLQDAGELCRQKPSPLSFVVLSGLSEMDFGWQAMEKAMEDAVAEQAAKLYRKIEYLSVIGNLAPMCGLLGTVTGMIFAFQQVAVSQGTAGAADLAEGIYSALVTTVAGLIVAIPSLGAFAVLRNRIDQLIAETAYMSQHVFAPVRRRATQVMSRGTAGQSGTGSGSVPPPRPRSN